MTATPDRTPQPHITNEAVWALRTAMLEWECGCLCDDRLRAALAAAYPHLVKVAR